MYHVCQTLSFCERRVTRAPRQNKRIVFDFRVATNSPYFYVSRAISTTTTMTATTIKTFSMCENVVCVCAHGEQIVRVCGGWSKLCERRRYTIVCILKVFYTSTSAETKRISSFFFGVNVRVRVRVRNSCTSPNVHAFVLFCICTWFDVVVRVGFNSFTATHILARTDGKWERESYFRNLCASWESRTFAMEKSVPNNMIYFRSSYNLPESKILDVAMSTKMKMIWENVKKSTHAHTDTHNTKWEKNDA